MRTHLEVRGRSRRAIAAGSSILLFVLAMGLTAVPASATAFTNAAAITIPAAGTGPGNSGPYPSAIVVSGLTGSVTDVNVTLSGLTHTDTCDVDVLLVGPAGQNVILATDGSDCSGVAGVNLTLDDAAVGSLPAPWATGTYKPTNNGEFSAPTPVGPYGATLAVFNGTDPNGTWNLYVYDDAGADVGTISGGWSVDITATAPHARTVKIHLVKSKVKGTVSVNDASTACANAVPVKVKVLSNGHWRKLGKATTSATGKFSVGGASADTKYKAIAKEITLASGDVCKAATSKIAHK